ncbi:MAG: TonB-dependent receptor, partial [Brevundimonas sp.]|nr:TonB-dependent receptor [Brevundimonas sp.]
MNWRIGSTTNLSAGLSVNDAKVVNFKAPLGTTQVIPAGTKLGYAPVWKGSMAVDHTVETGGFANVAVGVSMNFQSSQLSLFSADAVQRLLGTIPAYALVNAQIGLVAPDDRWKLSLVVRNLFDEGYAAAIVNGGVGGAYRYQIPRDADRYFGVTGRFNF